MKGIGIDLVEISRFKKLHRTRDATFFGRIFTETELNYCFGFKDAATHLAGTFAAKEAIAKALGAEKQFFGTIEIRRLATGAPVAYKDGKKMKGVFISITHTKTHAAAVAVAL